jgi:hypothetical protein
MGRRGLAAKNFIATIMPAVFGEKLERAVEDLASGPSGTRRCGIHPNPPDLQTPRRLDTDRRTQHDVDRAGRPATVDRRSSHCHSQNPPAAAATSRGGQTPHFLAPAHPGMLTGTGRVFLCTVTRNLRVGSVAGRMSSIVELRPGRGAFHPLRYLCVDRWATFGRDMVQEPAEPVPQVGTNGLPLSSQNCCCGTGAPRQDIPEY